MADADPMTLIDGAAEFFSALDSATAAGAPIAPYPLELMITTPQDRITVELHDGRLGAVSNAKDDVEPGYWTVELRGDRDVFEGIFAGALTMGEAMYSAQLVAPEEKPKHNLVCALGQTIQLVQEARRRSKDPRDHLRP